MTEANLVAFASSYENSFRDVFFPFPPTITQIVEGVDYRGMQRLILLRRGRPEQKRVDVEWYILVEERNREIYIGLGEESPVVVCETRSY